METQLKDYESASRAKSNFWILMQDLLGEQKIDIVFNYLGSTELLIYKVAREEGVRLL